MAHISLSVKDQERSWMENYAKRHGIDLSELIKEAYFEKLENEYSLKVIAEYEADPDKTTYSMADLVKNEMENRRVKTNVTSPAWLKDAAESSHVNYLKLLEAALIDYLNVRRRILKQIG